MEHVERQDEREQELRAVADQLEERGDQMEERGSELEHKVENVREEFRRKQQSEDVPGAQDPDELSDAASGPEADSAPGDRDE